MLPFRGKNVIVRAICTEKGYEDQFYILGSSDVFSVNMLDASKQCFPDDIDVCIPKNINKEVLVAIQKINKEIKNLQQIVTNLWEAVY